MGVFGNSNSLPISLVLSLSQTIKGLHWDKVPGDNDDEVAARGILYLLIFQQLGQLVRWSWGYNVLLAPADVVEDTPENRISRLENGSLSDERQPLLEENVEGSEDMSGSEETRVEGDNGKQKIRDTSNVEGALQSGEHTPVTCYKNASLVSSSKSMDAATRPWGPAPELLPAPVNGNLKPTTHTSPFPTNQSATEPIEEPIPEGFMQYPVRCRIGLKKGVRLASDRMSDAKEWIMKAGTRRFRDLPPIIQMIMTKMSYGLKSLFFGVWSFMNPPLWAMLAAIVVASIPDLQRFFFADGTFFKNSVTSAIRQSGGVAVPLILVVLGGNLARNTLPNEDHTKQDSKEETMLLIASLISRMLLPTIVMAPLLALTAKFVPVSILDDPIFVIVCFLITGAPSALQLAQICQIHNVYMGAMSRLLFQSYVVWILPSTLLLVMCALEVVEWAQR